MYEVEITFPEERLGTGNTVQLKMYLTTNDVPETWNASDKGLYVKSYGTLEWDYDIEQAVIVPGKMTIQIVDQKGDLAYHFFSEDIYEADNDKEAKIELYIDGVLEFSGHVLDESISYDIGKKLVEFTVLPKTYILQDTICYDEEGNPTDPLGYGTLSSTKKKIFQILEDIYQQVNSSISYAGGTLDIQHDWNFIADVDYGAYAITNAVHNLGVVTITVDAEPAFSDGDTVYIDDVVGMTDLNKKYFTVSNVDTTAKTFDVSLTTTQTYTSGGYTGQVYAGVSLADLYIYTNYIFQENKAGVNTLLDVLKKMAQDWAAFTGMLNESKAFFYKMFYYDASNLQELDTVLEYKKQYKYGLIDYVEVICGEKDTTTERKYTKGTYTYLDRRRLIRDQPIPNFFNEYPVKYTNLYHNVATNYYDIYWVNDPNLLSGLYQAYGNLLAEFWYNYRHEIINSRADYFKVYGLDYDFLKNFNYDNKKYQILRMRKHLEKGFTEIEALYIGPIT